MPEQAKLCEYCGHHYYEPCSDERRAAACPNVKLKDRQKAQETEAKSDKKKATSEDAA